MRSFVSAPIVAAGEGFITPATGGEPPVPSAFRWSGRTLEVTAVLRSWRSTKADRGDVYLKRHWFELETATGAKLEVYFDREARRGTPQWWLYTVDE
ncbi:MAG TPA: DUF6504 family protein [Candidatus Cybelea sp.]|nr:DUF6504 family protein [Candidatus Cybelea sp.]